MPRLSQLSVIPEPVTNNSGGRHHNNRPLYPRNGCSDFDDGGSEWPEWLRAFIVKLIGKDAAEFLAACAKGLRIKELAEIFGIFRHTVPKRKLRFEKLLRDCWRLALATFAHQQIQETDWVVVSPHRPLEIIRGPYYAWSLFGFERTYSGYPTVDDITGYITMFQEELFNRRHARLGLVFDDTTNETSVNITLVHKDKAIALALARKENQVVTDLATLQTVLDDTAERRRAA